MSTEQEPVTVEAAEEEKTETKEVKGTKRPAEVSTEKCGVKKLSISSSRGGRTTAVCGCDDDAWPACALKWLAGAMAKPIIESIIIPPFCHFPLSLSLARTRSIYSKNNLLVPTKKKTDQEKCATFSPVVHTTKILEREKEIFPPVAKKKFCISFFRR